MTNGMLGVRVAQIRIRRSITQEELAERAGVGKNTLCQIEERKADGPRTTTLQALADALSVPIASLFEAEAEDETVKEQDRALLLPLRRMLLSVVRAGDPVDEAGLMLAGLRRRVLDCTADYDHARYTKLAAEIPALIDAIDAAVGLHENEEKAAAYRLLAHAYMTTARLLIQLRDESLACVAVGQAMEAAENAGDPVLRASAAQDYTWAFIRQLMFDDAETIGVRMAAEIGEPSTAKGAPEHLAVWGRLLEGASRAAALDNRPQAAEELLSLAHSAAVRLSAGPMDYRMYHANFSPAKIAVTRAEIALIGGDAETALRLGMGLRHPANLRLDAWTYHLALMADAQASTRDYIGAIETMKSIHKLAPEWVKNHRVAHSVVLRLLDSTTVRRHRQSGLDRLAAFMEVRP